MTAPGEGRPAEPEEPPIRFTNNRKIKTDGDGDATSATPPPGDTDASPDDIAPPADETLAAPSAGDAPTVPLEDLQRLSAEYTNYRRRSERDRLAVGEIATGKVVAELLPVLDDLDRARSHGDLNGPFKAVADKLDAAFDKIGVTAFGEAGDPFDPSRHEAVLHDESDAVTVPTCTTIMRQGYQLGERLLRPAMVGVSDPAPGAGPATEDAIEDATAGSERHVQQQDQQDHSNKN